MGKGVGRITNLPNGFRRPFVWNKKTKYPEQGPIHQPPTGSWDSLVLVLSAEILYENKSSKQQLSKNKTKKVKRNRKKIVDYYANLQIFCLGCMILTFWFECILGKFGFMNFSRRLKMVFCYQSCSDLHYEKKFTK